MEPMRGFGECMQTPTQVIINLASNIQSGGVADNDDGATHFYSPRSMPKEGDPTGGFDVGAGLEQVPGVERPAGIPIRNYRPSWIQGICAYN